MVEAESVLAYSDEKPSGISIGNTTENGGSISVPNYSGEV